MSAHQASLPQAALVAKLTQPDLPRPSHARLATLEPYWEVVKENLEPTAHIEAQHYTSELDPGFSRVEVLFHCA